MFTITPNGDWLFEGKEIPRIALVRLFGRFLVFEDGRFWIKTPVEKVAVLVQDEPFVIRSIVERDGEWRFVLNDASEIVSEHISEIVQESEEKYIVELPSGLRAKVSRTALLAMSTFFEEEAGELLFRIGGLRIPIRSVC